MRIRLSTTLNAAPEWVAAQLQTTALFRHITAPILHFSPAGGAAWPAHWTLGEMVLHMRLWGALPLGRQTVRISVQAPAQAGAWPILRDDGEGTLTRQWDHRIILQPLPGGQTLYTDDVEVAARYLHWLMTPVSAAFAQLFFRHRQRRLRRWVDSHQAAPPSLDRLSREHRVRACHWLLTRCAREAKAPAALRWQWLEAAHVLGQPLLPLHWKSHTAMLRYAWALGDQREVRGQLLRLALVPVGHLLARLPRGNTGRAHVNALRPMQPPAQVQARVQQALEATACEMD